MAIALHTLILGATLAVFAGGQPLSSPCDPAKAGLQTSPSCGQVTKFGLNLTEIQDILRVFNSTNYGELTWSNDLALQAQAELNQCTIEETSCTRSRSHRFSVHYESTFDGVDPPAEILESVRPSLLDGAVKPRKTAGNLENHSDSMFSSFKNRLNHTRKVHSSIAHDLINRHNSIKQSMIDDMNKMAADMENFHNTIIRDAQKAIADARNRTADLRNSFAVRFPSSFSFSDRSKPSFNFNNDESLTLHRHEPTAGYYPDLVGCGFIVRKIADITNHKLLCYFDQARG